MMLQTGCFRSLLALAFALGVSPAAESEEILDNFLDDPDPFDGDPLTWETGHFTCCNAEVEERPGEGICVTPVNGPIEPGSVATREVFSGDVTAQVQFELQDEGVPYMDVFIHLGGGSGYMAWVSTPGTNSAQLPGEPAIWLYRWDDIDLVRGRNLSTRPIDFDPADGEVTLELRSRGEILEVRAWPSGDPRPSEPHIEVRDGTYREGSVAFAPGAPTCIRWVRITASPPLPPFLRGDCNGDGDVNISDATCALDYLFAGAEKPGCIAALNVNGDEKVDIADPVALLNFLFGGGPPIREPHPKCGPGELEADAELGCEVAAGC